MKHDHVDGILAQWLQQRPDVDASPMGVVGRITRLARALQPHLETTFARFDLTGWGFDVLATLRRAGPPYHLSPTALFTGMMVSSGTMTHRLDRLEEAGLVQRLPDPADRRGVVVALTTQGKAVVDEALTAHLETERRLLEALSDEEQVTLACLLRELLLSTERTGIGGQ